MEGSTAGREDVLPGVQQRGMKGKSVSVSEGVEESGMCLGKD